MAVSPDGRLLVTASGTITFSNSGAVTHRTGTTLWDVSNLRSPHPVANVPVWDGDGGIAFSPDGRVLALSSGGQGALWDIADPAEPRQLVTLTGQTQGIEAMAFSPDGRTLATAGQDNNAILWNTADPAHATRSAVLPATASPSAQSRSPTGAGRWSRRTATRKSPGGAWPAASHHWRPP